MKNQTIYFKSFIFMSILLFLIITIIYNMYELLLNCINNISYIFI